MSRTCGTLELFSIKIFCCLMSRWKILFCSRSFAASTSCFNITCNGPEIDKNSNWTLTAVISTHAHTHNPVSLLWSALPLGILHCPGSIHTGPYMVLVSLIPGLTPGPSHTSQIEQLVPIFSLIVFFCLIFLTWLPLQMTVVSHFFPERKQIGKPIVKHTKIITSHI